MPYDIKKRNDKYCLIKKDGGENVGCSETYEKAVAHMRARYAADSGAKMGKKKK